MKLDYLLSIIFHHLIKHCKYKRPNGPHMVNTSQRNRSGKVILNGLLANCPCRCSPELLGCSFLTWDNGNGVFLPGHHADVLLDDRGDEALEDGDITPHGALVSHTDCVRLPEHWYGKKRRQMLEGKVLWANESSEIE